VVAQRRKQLRDALRRRERTERLGDRRRDSPTRIFSSLRKGTCGGGRLLFAEDRRESPRSLGADRGSVVVRKADQKALGFRRVARQSRCRSALRLIPGQELDQHPASRLRADRIERCGEGRGAAPQIDRAVELGVMAADGAGAQLAGNRREPLGGLGRELAREKRQDAERRNLVSDGDVLGREQDSSGSQRARSGCQTSRTAKGRPTSTPNG